MSTIVVRAGVWLVLLAANAASGASMPVETSTRQQELIVAAVSLPAAPPLRPGFEARASSTPGAPGAGLQKVAQRSTVTDAADASDRSGMGMVMLISLAMLATVIVKGSRS